MIVGCLWLLKYKWLKRCEVVLIVDMIGGFCVFVVCVCGKNKKVVLVLIMGNLYDGYIVLIYGVM